MQSLGLFAPFLAVNPKAHLRSGRRLVRPTTAPFIGDLHYLPVLVVTDAGIPISVGCIITTHGEDPSAVTRVELEFETLRLKCTYRVPAEKWDVLIRNWDGEMTRYVLPHGDGFWLDERPPVPKARLGPRRL